MNSDSVRESQALPRGTSSPLNFEGTRTMPAGGQFPPICQSVKIAKVIEIQNPWIRTLKTLFTLGILIYIW